MIDIDKRDRKLLIRVNSDEYEVIKKKADKLNLRVAVYIRRMAVQGEIKRYDLSELRDITRSFRMIGTELNQIAKVANSTGEVTGKAVEEIQRQFEILEGVFENYLKPLKKNKDAFKGDDDYQLLSALENEDKEHGTFSKADIFEHNTVKPKTIAEHVETAQEALIISISEKAKVDFDYMSELCGMDKDSMIADLKGQIFRLPQAEEKYVTSDEYLTGNIRKKIAELNNAPEGMDVSENRAALENAIPPRVEAKDISVKLGSHWIAPEYIILLETSFACSA